MTSGWCRREESDRVSNSNTLVRGNVFVSFVLVAAAASEIRPVHHFCSRQSLSLLPRHVSAFNSTTQYALHCLHSLRPPSIRRRYLRAMLSSTTAPRLSELATSTHQDLFQEHDAVQDGPSRPDGATFSLQPQRKRFQLRRPHCHSTQDKRCDPFLRQRRQGKSPKSQCLQADATGRVGTHDASKGHFRRPCGR